MKILFIVNGTQALYAHRLELIQTLLVEGHSVDIASPRGKELEPLCDLGCGYVEAPIETRGKNVFQDVQLLFRYVKILKQVAPDVAFTFYTKSNIWGGIACQICGVRYVSNITGLGTAVENSGFFSKLLQKLYVFSLRKSSCVFFQNKYNYRFFVERGLKEGKAKLLPGSGVSLTRFPVLEYPSDEGMVEFLFVSRILKEKGIDEYIEAARVIREKHPNTKFHVVGNFDGGYCRDFDELQGDGVIVYHGQQFDIHPYILRTHCTILPSYYPEGMSNVLLESASSGRPVITTDRPGCIETVEDGVTGYVVKPCDVEDLVSKIECFLSLKNEERKEMGLRGRKKVEKEFSRDIVVKAYLQALGEIHAL